MILLQVVDLVASDIAATCKWPDTTGEVASGFTSPLAALAASTNLLAVSGFVASAHTPEHDYDNEVFDYSFKTWQ